MSSMCEDRIRASGAPCKHYLKPDIAAHPGHCGVPGTTKFFCTEAMRAKRWPFYIDTSIHGKEVKKMEKQSFDNGRFICIYGPTGVGKTTTLLQTCSNPIYYIQTEPRSLKPSIDAAARVDLDMDVAVYEGWNHLMESVLNPSNLVRYNTIILDSLSFIMNVELPVEIADQAFDARTEAEKQVKPLAGQTKLSQEGYGVLSALIFRLTAALGKLSRAGKVVVVTALLQETPKWNRALAAAPSLKGKEFPVNAPSFFDLIGLVETRTDTDGHIIYPPYVRFQSPDDSFLAKWTGVGTKTEGPLNITKILKL